MMPAVAMVSILAVMCAEQERVNADSAIIQTFLTRVNDYVKLRKKALQGLPAPSHSMKRGDLLKEQQRMAERIAVARPEAKQGDICSPEIAAELRRLIGISLNSPGAEKLRASFRKQDKAPTPLKVNAVFPDRLPMPTAPPTLLINLPHLPPVVDYRFVGSALVLRDTTAGSIIDFVPDALPVPQ